MQNDEPEVPLEVTPKVAPKAARKRASKDAPEETSERGVLTEVGLGISFYVRG